MIAFELPEQIICEEGEAIATGIGLTVILSETEEPTQLLADGVIV